MTCLVNRIQVVVMPIDLAAASAMVTPRHLCFSLVFFRAHARACRFAKFFFIFGMRPSHWATPLHVDPAAVPFVFRSQPMIVFPDVVDRGVLLVCSAGVLLLLPPVLASR